MSRELHLDLERISLELDSVKVNRQQHLATIAHVACRGVAYLHSRDQADIGRCEVAHEHSSHRPVDDIHAGQVSRTYRNISAASGTCCLQLVQFIHRMGKVGIHLNDVIIVLFKSPLETSDIGRSQALLAGTLEDVNALGLHGNHRVHDSAGAVGGIIVNDEHIKLVLSDIEHGFDNGSDVLLLVISRNDY